jgi:hypothetical protein
VANFFAGDVDNRGGVRVATHYLDDDNRADILVGLGPVDEPQVRTFLGKDLVSDTSPAALEISPFLDVEGDVVFVG